MTAKEYLRQARRLKISIKSKREYINQMYELCGLKSPVNDDVRVTGGEKMGFTNVIDTIQELTAEVDLQLVELARVHKSIIKEVAGIENEKHRLVLELYYLNCHTWDETAEIMEMSDRHVKRLHGEALPLISFPNVLVCHPEKKV